MRETLFRYPGGKSKLQKPILAKLNKLLDKPLRYCEPFFGGGSIGLNLLGHKNISHCWLNDKDLGLTSLWNSIKFYPDLLKAKIRAFEPSTEAFYLFRDYFSNLTAADSLEAIVEIGFRKLAIHQISYSGLGVKSGSPLGGKSQESNYKIDCRWSPEYLCNRIDLLNFKFSTAGSQGISFTSLDFEEVIGNTAVASLIYLDPPYYVKGSQLYQHGFTVEDHGRLADSLKNTVHKWLLSYDDCPKVRELYGWASIEQVSVNYSITATKGKLTGKRQSRNKSELLISPKSL